MAVAERPHRVSGHGGAQPLLAFGDGEVGGRTLLHAFDSLAGADPARGLRFVAADGSERFVPFRDVAAEARRRGRRLRALGLDKGDRLALVIPDADEFVLTFLGAVAAGIVPVPLYPPLSLGRLDAYVRDTARVLASSDAQLLVTTPQVQKILWSVLPRVPSLRDLVTVDRLRGPAPKADEGAGADRPFSVEVTPSDPLFLQFTSGSTAAPKGVVVTHGSLVANAVAILRDGLRVTTSDVGVSWLPLYHDMGLIGFVLAPLIFGIPVTFLPTLSFVRRPVMWMDAIHKYRGSITFAPNFAFARITKRASDADVARWDLSSLKVVGCGAEPIHGGTMRAFVERFERCGLRPEAMLPCYGMAEATLAMSFVGLDDRLRVDRIDADACYAERRAVPAGSRPDDHGDDDEATLELVGCGHTFPGHDLGIFSDDGARLGEREIGEIWFRGPSVADGYFRNPEATAASFGGPGGDGWLRTGDLGYVADGELFISGRKKDVLIIHGRNYYPQGIEWLCEEVAGVRKGNVVAFSVPGPASEEVVIVAETGEAEAAKRDEIAAEIKRHVNEEMGLAVLEVAVLGVGELPKTSSGKLQRNKTREQFLDGTLGAEGVRSMGATSEKLTVARHLVKSAVGRARHKLGAALGLRGLQKSGAPGPDESK
jgi:fatty-acyl-CoA synthase